MNLKDLIFALAFFTSRVYAQVGGYDLVCSSHKVKMCDGVIEGMCHCQPTLECAYPTERVITGHGKDGLTVDCLYELNESAIDVYRHYVAHILGAIGDSMPDSSKLDGLMNELSDCDYDSPRMCFQQGKIFIEQVVNFTSLRLKKIQDMNDQLKKMEDVARKVLAAYPELSEDAEIQAVLRKNIEDIESCRAL